MLYWVTPLLVIVVAWLTIFIYINDFSVPSKPLSNYQNILIVFPHPDDEVLTTGGLAKTAITKNRNVTFYVATKGEKGTPDAHFDASLKTIRTQEMERVASILGTDTLIVDDFGDGKLVQKQNELHTRLAEIIADLKPDLIITYDLSGMYGHEDHIVLSEIVTDLVQNDFPRTSLWYTSQPSKITSKIHWDISMAKDSSFIQKISYPTHKVFISSSILAKIQALYAHKSQYQSFRSAIPGKPIPMWFFVSMGMFEYFNEAYVGMQ